MAVNYYAEYIQPLIDGALFVNDLTRGVVAKSRMRPIQQIIRDI